MENSVDKQILFENFSGRSTPLRKQQIEEWLRAPGNWEQYYEWLDEWEKANPQFVPDLPAALQRMIEPGEKPAHPAPLASKLPRLSRISRHRLIAASLIVLVLATAIYSVKDWLLYRSQSTAYGETRSVILPDGSLVSMNGNSTIRYSRFGFGTTNRRVFLSGEADFSVTHAGAEPFIVGTPHNLDVVVLGTQFTVYTRASQDRVVLRQGKVQLNYARQQKKIILQPGDLFTTGAAGGTKIEHIANPENWSAWKDHEFLFEGTSMADIAGMIRDNFGLTVQFAGSAMADRRITGSFHADTAAELLDAIAQLLDIHYTVREGTIYFTD